MQTYATVGIIAEGVETEEELELVKELGISLVQGFLFGKPQELKGPLSLEVLRASQGAGLRHRGSTLVARGR